MVLTKQIKACAFVALGGSLKGSVRMAGSCAADLDQSRIAGTVCESTYTALIK